MSISASAMVNPPVTLIVVPLLLFAACLLRSWGARLPTMIVAIKLLIPLAAGGIVIGHLAATSGSGGGPNWSDDSVARGVLLVSCGVPLVVGLLESSPALLATTFWSAGLLALGSLSLFPAIQWCCLQFSILPLLFYGRTSNAGRTDLVARHPTLMLGSSLFSVGFLLMSVFNVTSPAATIGLVLLLCGIGGILGWFPFPRVAGDVLEDEFVGAVFGKRFLPLLTAAVFMFRMVERQPLQAAQANLLILAAFFSLFLCGVRLLSEDRLMRRLLLGSLSTLSFLLIAVCLQNWEFAHPDRDWQLTSNFPTGRMLFISILMSETSGLLALTCGFRLFQPAEQGLHFSQTLAGSARCRPWAAATSLAGLLTLAGAPPFPGFWWRFGLVGALLLPHRQSNVTQLTEADHMFALLALLVVGLLAVNSIGHLRLMQQMLFDEPFRVRGHRSSRAVQLATGMALAWLMGIMLVPLSLANRLTRTEMIETSEPTRTAPGQESN